MIKRLINEIENEQRDFWHPRHRHEKIDQLQKLEHQLNHYQEEPISTKLVVEYENAIEQIYSVEYKRFHSHGFFDQNRENKLDHLIETMDLKINARNGMNAT
jgi:hypothetical protein